MRSSAASDVYKRQINIFFENPSVSRFFLCILQSAAGKRIAFNGGAFMLHLSSWMTTLPMMLIGMTGILLVIGFLVLVVMALSCLTHRK